MINYILYIFISSSSFHGSQTFNYNGLPKFRQEIIISIKLLVTQIILNLKNIIVTQY